MAGVPLERRRVGEVAERYGEFAWGAFGWAAAVGTGEFRPVELYTERWRRAWSDGGSAVGLRLRSPAL